MQSVRGVPRATNGQKVVTLLDEDRSEAYPRSTKQEAEEIDERFNQNDCRGRLVSSIQSIKNYEFDSGLCPLSLAANIVLIGVDRSLAS
jgi:hypothetical protein